MASERFDIDVRPHAMAALDALRAFDRRKITQAIESMLRYEPLSTNRNRKELPGVVTAFEFAPPLWQLRVGEYRVFYDVDKAAKIVRVRAVRYKPPDRTTQEIVI